MAAWLIDACVAAGLGISLLYGLDAKRPPAGLWLPDQGVAPYRGRG